MRSYAFSPCVVRFRQLGASLVCGIREKPDARRLAAVFSESALLLPLREQARRVRSLADPRQTAGSKTQRGETDCQVESWTDCWNRLLGIFTAVQHSDLVSCTHRTHAHHTTSLAPSHTSSLSESNQSTPIPIAIHLKFKYPINHV